jgi:hypothetical protein
MTFLSDDYRRQLLGDTKIFVTGFRDLKGSERQRLFDFIWAAIYAAVNEGERDERTIRRRVLRETREEFGSVILIAILMAAVSFLVTSILERLFPKD